MNRRRIKTGPRLIQMSEAMVEAIETLEILRGEVPLYEGVDARARYYQRLHRAYDLALSALRNHEGPRTEADIRAEALEEAARVAEQAKQEAEAKLKAALNKTSQRNYAAALEASDCIAKAIRALKQKDTDA